MLAYEGALAFHGLVTLGNSLSFLTNERPSKLVLDEVVYQPVACRAPSATSARGAGNILTAEREGQSLKVTSVERTLVDMPDRLDLIDSTRVLWDCFGRAKPSESSTTAWPRAASPSSSSSSGQRTACSTTSTRTFRAQPATSTAETERRAVRSSPDGA